jgi:uncharacterized protein YidB (DUF937 family)
MLDGLSELLQGAIAKNPSGVSGVLDDAFKSAGGLDGVVQKLNSAGLGSKVNSWLGNGDNAPLTADEVRSALSSDHINQVAAKLGIPADAVPDAIAQHLPNAVDQAAHSGKLASAVAAAANIGGKAA